MRTSTRRAVCVMAAALAILAAVAGCVSGGRRPAARGSPAPGPVLVTSFDFDETKVLAALYAQALEQAHIPVRQVPAFGSRETVEPALQEGLVDFLPTYLGHTLDFLERARVATANAAVSYQRLQHAYAARGITTLGYAAAANPDVLAVTREVSSQRRLHTISELRTVAPSMVFLAPPECAKRELCLLGLQTVYGLRFRTFLPVTSAAVRAAALDRGDADVALMFSTDGYLATTGLVVLTDDRRLQPAENIVPVVRTAVLRRYGDRLVRAVHAITQRLTTNDLVELNIAVTINGEKPATAAREWLAVHGLLG